MIIRLAAAGLLGLLLAACSSDGGRSSLGDIGSSFGSRFTRDGDTNGTQRRMDVYGGSTAPVLPTIGSPGFGK